MNSIKTIKNQGFTIIELILVIVIIGILAAVTIVGYRGTQEKATQASFLSSLESYEQMLRSYKTKHGYYPPVRIVNTSGAEISNVGGPLGTVCLGDAKSGLEKTEKFPANACWVNNSVPAVVANEDINTILRSENKILPNVPSGTTPIGGSSVTINGQNFSNAYVRGLVYTSTRGPDGRSFNTNIVFLNYGNQSCGHAKIVEGAAQVDGKQVSYCQLKLQ